jgi:hypothetical protein
MRPTYARQTPRPPAPTASTALFVDAGYVRRCAASIDEMISGSGISAGRVSIDACQISRLLDSVIVDFELEASRSRDGRRPGRRIYDTIDADRRQRCRQLHYRSVVKAERFVVKTVRPPRWPTSRMTGADAHGCSDGVAAALAEDLTCLAAQEITMVVLLAGGERYAGAVLAARELGTDVVLLVPAGCGALVAEPLRAAATRVIGLHPEVFEALFEAHGSGGHRRSRRGWARPAGVAGVR